MTDLTLTQRIKASLETPLGSDAMLKPETELESILSTVELSTNSAGGKVTFTGKDPILKSPWTLATMGGVALMAKSVAAADLWR